MYWWRVTKYNPKHRTKRYGYMLDTWTEFCEIGYVFDDGLLTYQEYRKAEDTYIQAIFLFMDYLKIDTLTIFQLRQFTWYKDLSPLTAKMQLLFEKNNRQKLNKQNLYTYIQLLLRGYFGAKLKHGNTMEIHFGDDFYMYVGTAKPCYTIHKLIKESGLFVENYISPYLYY